MQEQPLSNSIFPLTCAGQSSIYGNVSILFLVNIFEDQSKKDSKSKYLKNSYIYIHKKQYNECTLFILALTFKGCVMKRLSKKDTTIETSQPIDRSFP